MNKLNTVLCELNRENLNTFRDYTNIHMIGKGIRKGDRYNLKISNGSTIGEVRKFKGGYSIYFFDGYNERIYFSREINQIIDKVKNIAKKVKSGKLSTLVSQIPMYYTAPRKKFKGNISRIFQPIDKSKGEYLEITNEEIGGKIIRGCRKVNIYSENPNRWQYQLVA